MKIDACKRLFFFISPLENNILFINYNKILFVIIESKLYNVNNIYIYINIIYINNPIY